MLIRIRIPEFGKTNKKNRVKNIGLYYDLKKLIGVVERFKLGTKTSEGREAVFAFVRVGSVCKTASHG